MVFRSIIAIMLASSSWTFGSIAVVNGTFNTNINYWDKCDWNSANVVFQWVGTDGHNSAGCAKMTNAVAGAVYGVAKRTDLLNVAVTPGQSIVISAWVKTSGSAGAWLEVYQRDSLFVNRGSFVTSRVQSADWKKLEMFLQIPADIAWLRIDVRASEAGTFYVDDVEINDLEYNFDFEDDSEALWPNGWACVAWPAATSRAGRTTGTAYTGNSSLEFIMSGASPRCAALNYIGVEAMPLGGVASIGIAHKSTGPGLSMLVNYYLGNRRIGIEKFGLTSTSIWRYSYCSLNPTYGADRFQIEIWCEGATGTAWVDSIMATAGGQSGLVYGNNLALLYTSRWGTAPGQFAAVPGNANETYEPLVSSEPVTMETALEQYKNVHPRLIFRNEDIAKIRSWAKGTHSGMYDWLMSGERGLFSQGGRRGSGIILFAFGWLLNQDASLLWETKWWMFDLCNNYYLSSDFESSFGITGLALGYDWVFNTLSARERDELRLKLAIFTKPWYDYYLTLGQAVPWQFNHFNHGPGAYGLAGMALYGDGNPYGGDAGSLEWAMYGRYGVGRIVETLPVDGSYQEGLHYMNLVADWWFKYIEALRRFTGEDLFKESTWFKNAMFFELFEMTPDWKYKGNFSDSMLENIEENPSVVLRLSARENTEFAASAAWMADKANETWQMVDSKQLEKRVWEFLFYQPDVTPKSPEQSHLTLYRHFNDIDVATVRSDWSNESSMFMFKCGPYGGHAGAQLREAGGGGHFGHNHPDAASFMIFHRNIPIAVDSGYTTVKRTNGHNTFLVNNYAQVGDGYEYTGTVVPYSKAARITKYFGSDAMFYVKGQAGGCYASGASLTKYDRQIIGVEGKWFVIVDDLAAGANRNFKWLLNTRRAGSIAGRTATVVDDGGPVGITPTYAGRDYIGMVNPGGASTMVVTFLKPDALTIASSMEYVEEPWITWTQVWRLAATSASTTSSRFITVVTLQGPGEATPAASISGSDTITIDDGSDMAEIKLLANGATMYKKVGGKIVAIGAVGANQVTVDGQSWIGDNGVADWCKVMCGYHNTQFYAGDLNGDCYVELGDFATAAGQSSMTILNDVILDWLECSDPESPVCRRYAD
ncbi:MAG: hypothetical protein A2Y07_03150 [Planctomycetes bacterium GWF2_50_10]|nr:MAG: hypothetical protein A2Y07_03150 [Planctomycetes bacterium GWF2_50_10]